MNINGKNPKRTGSQHKTNTQKDRTAQYEP